MKDDALAPVIAIMLILAIIVTFYSLWNALIIPSMKQSSEVEHLQNVESSFQQFSSDIEKAVSLKQDGIVFSEPVQLGGGDVMLDQVRSGGSLFIKDDPVYTLVLSSGSEPVFRGTAVNISFEPLNNYWQDQGYLWQSGYINVTKYQTRQTPLGYYNMTDVANDFSSDTGSLKAFAGSLGMIEVNNTGPGFNIIVVNLTTSSDHSFVSGNGFGTLKLVTRMDQPEMYSGITSIELQQVQGNLGNAMAMKWKEILTEKGCTSTINENDYLFTTPQTSTITLTTGTIEVSAY